MIRIAYILTPVEFGGSETVSLTFLKNVDRSQFDIYPILFIRPWEEDNVFIKQLEKENYPIFKIPVAKRPKSGGRDYFRIVRCYKRLHSVLSEGSFHLIHTHGYFADILATLAAILLRIPRISTYHGLISNDKTLMFYNILDHIILRFSNEIIAVSEEIKDELIRIGIKGTRIKVILNAVPTKVDDTISSQNRQKIRGLFGIKEEEFVVGYVGRLSQEKGIKHLIESTSLLIESGIPIKVLIIGDGPQRKELEALASEQEAKQEIIFSGFQENIENWFPAMDVFVLPSLTEGTPMALLEAMAFGLPVVASAVGGVPRIIESGKNGILVSGGNPVKLKDTIKKLYENKSLRENISKEARTTVKVKYDVKSWAKKIENEYMKTIGQ